MADPLSSNIGLSLPTRGSDSGTWDSPLNSNANGLDGLFGGVLSLSLGAAATTTLTQPAGFTPTPAAGPVQAQNAMIKLTGTLTGNNVLVCTRPGFYIVFNNCATTTWVVTMSNGAGSTVGLAPGVLQHVFNDGTNYYHCDMGLVGELKHLAGATAIPAWITASTQPPFILCDGSIYNISAYPIYGNQVGSTYGGNGSTTFGVPDLRGRLPLAYDGTGTRITASNAGFNGQTLGASGGSANQTLGASSVPLLTSTTESQQHQHNFTGTLATNTQLAGAGSGNRFDPTTGNTLTQGETANHTHQVGTATPSAFTTVMPSQVTGIWLVRAA